MSLSDDWRQRHGQRKSDSKLLFYILILLAILFFISRSGDFSRQFLRTFMGSPDSTSVETTGQETDE
ncbi:hypothetical protein DRQ21_03690 [Candidatus Fermentibacteria bacterium]|nr:MAG: hypothetical protein DRQ21_03690 [Candidatus Fermentibacteria bacterium]